MEMRFNLDSCTALVISDQSIPDPRPGSCSGGYGPAVVHVQLVHTPLAVDEPTGPDFVQNIGLRPSEARTIASALMTAAQSVR